MIKRVYRFDFIIILLMVVTIALSIQSFYKDVHPQKKSIFLEPLNTPSSAIKYLSDADKYIATKEYFQAIREIKRVPYEDKENYYTAQALLSKCLQEMHPYYISMAESYNAKQQYKEGYELLNKLLPFYPQDNSIPELISQLKNTEFQKTLVDYQGPVQHIFFHPLLAYPEKAFDHDGADQDLNDWFVTAKEFHRIINSLYRNNFILIDIHALYEEKEENGIKILQRKVLRLPKGKKPLIISIDDLNYYDYMKENGTVSKLVLDGAGDIAASSKSATGQNIFSYDTEIVPILDDFVNAHSDFSFKGAKGMIAVTGFDGILGYKTNTPDSPTYQKDKEDVLKVIKRLKDTGWSFASHGYGHLDSSNVDFDRFIRDTDRWKQEVEVLVGKTSIYIYPLGSDLLPGNDKFNYLIQSGFNILCGVSNREETTFLPNCLLMNRRHIDGIALLTEGNDLKDLFNPSDIIDKIRPSFHQ